MMATETKQLYEVVFTIRRYDPEMDKAPHYERYKLAVTSGMTVLDGLHRIREEQDQSLSWRYSCRMGVCGSCGMLVNGKPMLACNNQILDISKKHLVIAPMPNFDIIKDLVPDLSGMFDKHISVMPFIQREDTVEREEPTGEYYQTPEELERYLQFSYCIRCGLCMSACPTLATDLEYLGPMPMTQAYRLNADTRDEGFHERKKVTGDTHGAFRCHYAGECSNVCPKGVDPARAIQFLKRQLVLDYFKLRKQPKGCGIVGPPKDAKRREGIPEAPAYTIEQKG